MERKHEFVRGLRKAWRDEMISARNYRELAEREKNPDRKRILARMAEAEERHAATWEKQLREIGEEPGRFSESLLERMKRWVLMKSDSDVAVKILEAGESDADGLYDRLLSGTDSPEVRTSLLRARTEERAHNRMLG